uniref:POT1PC domain-containing protein n=1 Tax=Meloidogyne hapla TaxID=6305 RepID=A0A1I8B4K7_MELHA
MIFLESTITISTTNNDENKLINSQVVSSSNSLDIQPIEQQNVYLDDSFMPDLHKYLSKWRQRGIFKLVQIDFHKRFLGQFVNLNCLVFSVIVPSQGLPVYLQICDGTKLPAPTKSINTRENCSQVQSALFDGNLDYENVREYFQVISCFDEFAEQAKTIQAGDIIQARNVHARTFFYPYHTFTLRGLNGQQNPFNRGIQLLARKGKTLFKEKRTIVMKNSI